MHMIGQEQINVAALAHIEQAKTAEVLDSIGVDHTALGELIGTMVSHRNPAGIRSGAPEDAYIDGFMDGFTLGVKSVMALYYPRCDLCTDWGEFNPNLTAENAEQIARIIAEAQEEAGKRLGVEPEMIDIETVSARHLCATCMMAVMGELSV